VPHARQDLVRVLGRLTHDFEDFIQVVIGHELTEEVAHAVHENHPGCFPSERLVQALWS